MQKLIVSCSPHVAEKHKGTRRIMLDVIIALCPALIAATVLFGYHVLINAFFSVLFCAASETLFCLIKSGKFNRDGLKNVTTYDLSCVVTGLLIALNLPAVMKVWGLNIVVGNRIIFSFDTVLVCLIGSIVAIVLVKELFGGIGRNFANPALTVLDIQPLAALAHKHKIPLIVDNTFATPYLCRPLEWGADIVIHSTSKYLDGHAVALGGVIVDGGKFDWEKSGKFDCLVQPDESYHGLSYTKSFGNAAYIVKARVQLMRDLGSTPSPMNAFLLDLGMQTLHLRMERHSANALAVAKYLSRHPKVKSITYPALEGDRGYDLCNKYLGGKGSGVISFELGSYDSCVRFMDSLRLAAIVVHVADARTGVLHPASSTHRQLSEEQLVAAGISKGTVRLSVGIENVDDIIADLAQALIRA